MLVRVVLLSFLLVLLTGCVDWYSEPQSRNLSEYKHISVDISEDNLQKLHKTSLVNEWVSCELTVDGEQRIADIRRQGNGARKHPKISLKAQYDDYTTVLSAQFLDKSFSRYYLTDYLFRKAGFKTSELEPIVLFINDKYEGLYLQREVVDENFLQRNGYQAGSLYRANFGVRFTFETNMAVNAGFSKKYPPDDESYYDLEELILLIDRFPQSCSKETLNRAIDIKNVLDYIAVSQLTSSFDCITYNFYLMYNKESKKFQFIPWDLDRTFGSLGDDLPVYYNGLFEKLLAVEEYAAYVKKRQQELFNPTELKEVLKQYQERIRYAYEADPYLAIRTMESHAEELGAYIDSVHSYLHR